MKEQQIHINRSGRDALGSNWQFAFSDPDFITNELYYGMDQIGWDGASKPFAMVNFEHVALPESPIGPDFQDALAAFRRGVDPREGVHARPEAAASYDVGGVKLPRPFRICRNGPIRLFVKDVDAAIEFYRDVIGLSLTEEIDWRGHRCAFLRVNTEHHTIALYPLALRAQLPLRQDCLCMAFGLQLGGYKQLRDAIAFLGEHGLRSNISRPSFSRGSTIRPSPSIPTDMRSISTTTWSRSAGRGGRGRKNYAARSIMRPGPRNSTPCRIPISDRYSTARSARAAVRFDANDRANRRR